MENIVFRILIFPSSQARAKALIDILIKFIVEFHQFQTPNRDQFHGLLKTVRCDIMIVVNEIIVLGSQKSGVSATPETLMVVLLATNGSVSNKPFDF